MNDDLPDHFDGAPGAQGASDAAGAAHLPPPAPPPPPGAMPAMRRNRSLLVAAAVAGTLIAGAAVGVPLGLLTRGSQSRPSSSASLAPSPASSAAVQARALYQQALAAASRSAGFHYIAVSTGGTGAQKIVGDAGQDGGNQVITINSTYGSEQFTLVLVSGTVYFEGNTPALQDQLGVPAANSPGMQGKWVSVLSGDGPYGVVAPGITVADQVQETALVPTSATQMATAGGISRILGTVPTQQGAPGGTAHLDIAAGSHLPMSYVSAVTVSGVTTTGMTTFSGWGTAPSATAPPGAVAWSTLGASQPPGGYGSGGSSTSSTPQA